MEPEDGEPNRTITGMGKSSSSGGYYSIENYHVVNVTKADTSIFQEILGYQEQLRIEYANKAEAILNKPAEERERNARFADTLSRISFADVYHFAVGTITGTDRQCYNDFIQNSRAYKREIVEYLKDKEAFSSRAWFSTDKGAARTHRSTCFSTSTTLRRRKYLSCICRYSDLVGMEYHLIHGGLCILPTI